MPDRARHHGPYRDSWDATWLWADAANATPGVYTATLRISNDQQTAELVRHVRFNIGPATDEELACGDLEACHPLRIDAGATTESPGMGLLVLAPVVVAAIVRAKRPES